MTRLNTRLGRLERAVPRPKGPCPRCGLSRLADGRGVVDVGYLFELDDGRVHVGCKACFGWAVGRATPRADGRFELTEACLVGPPEAV